MWKKDTSCKLGCDHELYRNCIIMYIDRYTYIYICMYVKDFYLFQIEDEYFIELHINGNATLGNKATVRLVILTNDNLILTRYPFKG